MKMDRRMLYTPIFHLDTNCINARGKLEHLNQLEKWARDYVVLINLSEISASEAQKGNNAARNKKALSHIFTMIYQPLDRSDPMYRRVAFALFSKGIKNEKQNNDVKIVCHAIHYHAILITNDGASKRQPGGILGNAHKLADIVKILNPEQAVRFIREKIIERDDRNRKISDLTGNAIPEWTGCD